MLFSEEKILTENHNDAAKNFSDCVYVFNICYSLKKKLYINGILDELSGELENFKHYKSFFFPGLLSTTSVTEKKFMSSTTSTTVTKSIQYIYSIMKQALL